MTREEKEIFSRDKFKKAKATHRITDDRDVTREARQKASKTGKLAVSVDPALGPTGPVRLSLIRFNPTDDGRWVVAVGCPMDIESTCDTTGSMGDNVDIAMKVLPDTYELASAVLPGYDLQLAIGIFGDVSDNFVLCRPQFEMSADKIVGSLKDMVPEGQGGDATEDPQYGLFGAAYFTKSYINRIGLKGYHFAISDAPARTWVDANNLERVFGSHVWEDLAANGHQITRDALPSTREIVTDLQKRAHAFFLQVGDRPHVAKEWSELYGKERVILLPRTEYIPHVQAAIIGLTEGTLCLQEIKDFLTEHNMEKTYAERLIPYLANMPIGEQAALRAKMENPIPKVGDIYIDKTDLWPADISSVTPIQPPPNKPNWL